MFIPTEETNKYVNIKLDRGALSNIFQYNNLVDTDKYGNNIPGQTTIYQDLQFNVALSPLTGRKEPSLLSNTGVAAIRVFEEASFEYNHLQNYRNKGTLRVAKPLNP